MFGIFHKARFQTWMLLKSSIQRWRFLKPDSTIRPFNSNSGNGRIREDSSVCRFRECLLVGRSLVRTFVSQFCFLYSTIAVYLAIPCIRVDDFQYTCIEPRAILFPALLRDKSPQSGILAAIAVVCTFHCINQTFFGKEFPVTCHLPLHSLRKHLAQEKRLCHLSPKWLIGAEFFTILRRDNQFVDFLSNFRISETMCLRALRIFGVKNIFHVLDSGEHC